MELNFESEYQKFQIPEPQVPKYINAESFTSNIKKCSLLEEVSVTYSDSVNFPKPIRSNN